jgi:hypothetical protein
MSLTGMSFNWFANFAMRSGRFMARVYLKNASGVFATTAEKQSVRPHPLRAKSR